MSNTNQGTMSFQGGSYSLQSRLSEVRSKLFEINKTVSELESNVLFLLCRPDLINYSPKDSSEQETSTENADTQKLATDNSAYYRWEPTFITNPSKLHSKIDERMSLRYELMVSEGEISDALYEEKKQRHSERNDLPYDDSKTIEHHSY